MGASLRVLVDEMPWAARLNVNADVKLAHRCRARFSPGVSGSRGAESVLFSSERPSASNRGGPHVEQADEDLT